jgi:N-formylglutamate amidohydrolase
MLRFTVCLLLAASSLAHADQPDKLEAKLLTTQSGTIPIILSAPHGGEKPIPNCPERLGVGVDKFVTVIDTRCDLLASKVAAALEKTMNGKPYLVTAQFLRKNVDVNRPAQDAYESPIAKPYYDAYHQTLQQYRDAVQKEWGRGLLIDIHGQAADSAAIYRGTNNGKTVRHMLDRFGRAGFVGEQSVMGRLEKAGYKVIPSAESKEDEDRRFGGGYIVATYGSKESGSIDAIQLETGGRMRTGKGMDEFATALAEAIAAYSKEYLPATKLDVKP